MVFLTSNQKEELNSAILEYLTKHKYLATAKQFEEEANVELTKAAVEEKSSVKKDLLEKKWTSVVRLKKQVMELEKLNKQLKESASCERCEGMTDIGGGMGSKLALGDGLPREPEKYLLQGHRAKITKVVIHPFYNMAATASEDASIRLWDFD